MIIHIAKVQQFLHTTTIPEPPLYESPGIFYEMHSTQSLSSEYPLCLSIFLTTIEIPLKIYSDNLEITKNIITFAKTTLFMCTLTVSYDPENALAIKMIELMHTSGVFSFLTEQDAEASANEGKEVLLYTSRINDANMFSKIPTSYEEALNMGAKDVEFVREDLHDYVDELAKEYKLQ